MLDRFLSPRRVRQIQRLYRNGKLTVLCLLLTIVVMRGIVGAGKFGTPEKDLDEIRQTFAYMRKGKGVEPRRVLEEAKSVESGKQNGSSSSGAMDNADFDTRKEEPYSVGGKISDWDEKRGEWLKRNPNLRNYIGPKKPRVLLVSGSFSFSKSKGCADDNLVKSIKNKMDYCRVHGMEVLLVDAEMGGFWGKLPLIRKLLLSHPQVELLWWMDSDAVFTDMGFEVGWERYKEHNFVMHGGKEKVYDEKKWIGLRSGSILLRNCQWSLDILDRWAAMVIEADDESGMVYILGTEKDKWGDKVYVETSYNNNNNYYYYYWGIRILVDSHSYEEKSYPLVTQFVGCKPCGKLGDYPLERCLKQMERALNFGRDNQILNLPLHH